MRLLASTFGVETGFPQCPGRTMHLVGRSPASFPGHDGSFLEPRVQDCTLRVWTKCSWHNRDEVVLVEALPDRLLVVQHGIWTTLF